MNWWPVVKKRGLPERRSLMVRAWSANRRVSGNRHVRSVGVFILCVNLWRYSHLMRSSILTLWGHGQSKSLFLQPSHSHVMRKPTAARRARNGANITQVALRILRNAS
jgi:hypothetical protein